MVEEANTGGKPHTVGEWTSCGKVYLVRENEDEQLQPIGTDDLCNNCGNNKFTPVQDTELSIPTQEQLIKGGHSILLTYAMFCTSMVSHPSSPFSVIP